MAVGTAAEMPAFPMRSVSPKSVVEAYIHCVVGTSGAITTTGSYTSDSPDITITINGSTGVYDLAFPPSLSVSPSVSITYASSTTVSVKGSAAPSATNGTWQITFTNAAGSAAWPVSTDQFDVCLRFETEPA